MVGVFAVTAALLAFSVCRATVLEATTNNIGQRQSQESDVRRTIVSRNSHSGNPVSGIDLRVTPAMGSRDQASSHVRISVITNASSPLVSQADSNFFDYAQPFAYRWKQKFLHSTLKGVSPGQTSNFTINGTSVSVFVPKVGTGTRGVIIADPCFHGAAAGCEFGEKFKTFSRMTTLLNLATADPAATNADVDYWMILGDNFYDRHGDLSQQWFDQLTLRTKSKLFATVAGNHDYWALGDSIVSIDSDQFGNGHMQFYGMDSVASVAAAANSSVPGEFLDLSIDPDAAKTHRHLAAMENFFSYFTIGNVAFVLYSGGYSYADSKPLFEEACAWLKQSKPDVAFIAGHWNDAGAGCSATMDVPAVYSEIKDFDGCAQLDEAMQLKYIMGHTHCNEVTAHDSRGNKSALGIMVAGQGMEGCGNFGVPLVDTMSDGRVEVLYFDVQSTKHGSPDNFDAISSCWAQHGIAGCKQLATVWLNQSLTPVDWS